MSTENKMAKSSSLRIENLEIFERPGGEMTWNCPTFSLMYDVNPCLALKLVFVFLKAVCRPVMYQ